MIGSLPDGRTWANAIRVQGKKTSRQTICSSASNKRGAIRSIQRTCGTEAFASVHKRDCAGGLVMSGFKTRVSFYDFVDYRQAIFGVI